MTEVDKEATSRKLAEKFGVDKERPHFDEDYRFPVKLLLADDTERLIDLAQEKEFDISFFENFVSVELFDKYYDNHPTKRDALNAALCKALMEV